MMFVSYVLPFQGFTKNAMCFLSLQQQVTLTSADGVSPPQKFTTNTVQDNGFNPIWDSPAEATKFAVTNAAVQLLCFEVWDEDTLSQNDFIGSFVLPVKLVIPFVVCHFLI